LHININELKIYIMKTNGYPINKNGKVIMYLPREKSFNSYQGKTTKENGTYLFFRFKRNGLYIYSY